MPTVHYYVLAADPGYQIKREGKPEGVHDSLERVSTAAQSMASIEASLGNALEVLAHDANGFRAVAEFLPRQLERLAATLPN